MIISAKDLYNRLGEENLILVDCYYNEHEYRRGHIPGAIKRLRHPYVKSGNEEEPGLFYPKRDEFEHWMRDLGINQDSFVVAYDSDGSLFATRFLWGLQLYGHTKFALLDGGWQAWINAGYSVSVKIHESTTFGNFRSTEEQELIITRNQLLEALHNPDFQIIDVRSTEEYLGNDSRGNLRKGRVPGAIHLEWTELLNTANTTEEVSTIKSYREISDLLESRGINLKKNLVTYCQGGVRASLIGYILRFLGAGSVQVYDGSMKEWANEKDLPLET